MEKTLLSAIDYDALSPMMKHYYNIKKEYPDCIVLYRLGDFYEMFFDDAVTASRVLEITLTGRDCGLNDRAPMCGIPYHAVENYVPKLVAAGYKVAICEQLELPSEAKGMVDRGIVRVISAGTVIEDNMLDSGKNNYLVSLYKDKDMAIAWVDVSTGDFCCIEHEWDIQYLNNILSGIAPAEIICSMSVAEYFDQLNTVFNNRKVPPMVYYDWAYNEKNCVDCLKRQLSTISLKSFDLENRHDAVCACGALMEYLKETQKRALSHITRIKVQDSSAFMILDGNTRKHLELTEAQSTGKTYGSLLWAIDKTTTNMGRRNLRKWIEQPLLSRKDIILRQDAVAEVIDNDLCVELAYAMRNIRDLERLLTRFIYNNGNPQHLLAISETLHALPELRNILKDCKSKYLTSTVKVLKDLPTVYELIDKAIKPDAPAVYSAGGFVKRGFNAQLDEYLLAKENGSGWLAEYEANEREALGIKNLRVGYNKVFGYYIEIPRSFKGQLPYNYVRKQTTVNYERFITNELKEIEDKLLNAEEMSVNLELKIFEEIKQKVVDNAPALQDICKGIAGLDCINSLAAVAIKQKYVRPIIAQRESKIVIKGGRHPVIEQTMSQNQYISNDCLLDEDDNNVIILTGPNMSGKSTYMKSVALIVLLAQIGSYVPAEMAEIAVVDRIFTRIGASDDLLNNQSTFMVEMLEVSEILNCATENSLLILDEIGRGTSTYDGLSIAWAIIEEIAKVIKAKTLFATHYHEITDLEEKLKGVKNYKVLVDESSDKIVFLHKIARGPASKSFGIEVAEMAGVPESVIKRAHIISSSLDQYRKDIDIQAIVMQEEEDQAVAYQPSFLDATDEIRRILRDTDVNSLTPMQALIVLADLVKKAKENL